MLKKKYFNTNPISNLHNPIVMTDSYKVSHHKLYPLHLRKVESYLEARVGAKFDKILFFGLQYYLMKLEEMTFTQRDIDEAAILWEAHFGRKDVYNRVGWEYILKNYNGKLPLRIRAIPEGTIVSPGVVLMVIEVTDDHCAWLVNYMESFLLKVWYPITVGSQSFKIRNDVMKHLEKSGTPESIGFKVHDFGYRGVSSEETAAIGGAAHLISSMGTDNVVGLLFAMEYYGANVCAFSVAATEHSIMCAHSKNKNDLKAFEFGLEAFPSGLLAMVADTYDIRRACRWAGTVLKEKILSRDGVIILRPDSGIPKEIVPECLNILWEGFGGSINDKKYKLLDPHIRLIQGDGMDSETIGELYATVVEAGFSADNLTVGSGGGLLQKVNRDTLRMAIKADAVLIGQEWIDIMKDPVTDPGKSSKAGRHTTFRRGDEIFSAPITFSRPGCEEIMETVFENGEIKKIITFDEVKRNAGTL